MRLSIYYFTRLNGHTDTCPQDSWVFIIVGFLLLDCVLALFFEGVGYTSFEKGDIVGGRVFNVIFRQVSNNCKVYFSYSYHI